MEINLQGLNNLRHDPIPERTEEEISVLVENLLGKMTIREKIGQLYESPHQGGIITGPEFDSSESVALIKEGLVGSFLGLHNTQQIYNLQKIAVEETRLGIPLFFAFDVIHGFKTIFPINLGMACSWDEQLIEKACNVIADETSHSGVNLTFSPMLDLVRDPRWGRVMESNGEDPYLGSVLAKAYVRGYQKDKLTDQNSIGACVKHYIGYGAAEGGREYNTVDMSRRQIFQNYLPPFAAAIEENVASVMTSFNIVDSIPATANEFYLKEVLRNQLQFNGFVVSDYESSKEIIEHKIAKDEKEAAYKCIKAGLDHEMVSQTYLKHLEELVESGEIDTLLIDDAARRILTFKYKIGLFDDPYKNVYDQPEQYYLLDETRELAREMSRHSIVLLKNKGVLPLKNDLSVAIIGPHSDNKEVIGGWGGVGENKDCISLLEGINNLGIENLRIKTAKGCSIEGDDTSGFSEAINLAKESDVVILAVGEEQYMSGEGYSRAYLNLPGVQEDLVKEIVQLGKKVILVIFSGRPLDLTWYDKNVDAIIETWFLGSESGNAIADVLFGKHNPSGKLSMSFPYTVGQIPVYYNHHKTGRPPRREDIFERFSSRYADIPNKPLYPFGYGLSYTTYEYSKPLLSKDKYIKKEPVNVKIKLKNTGVMDGYEIIQLYIEAQSFSVSRPVRELKRFKKVFLKQGEEKEIEFKLYPKDFSYYNIDMEYVIEDGKYNIFIGGCSSTDNGITIEFI